MVCCFIFFSTRRFFFRRHFSKKKMPVVRYIARHEDLVGTFTHGKINVANDEFCEVTKQASLNVQSETHTYITLYRALLLTYETKGLVCQTCGKKRTFVANPVFFITTDPEAAAHECTLRCTVNAGCLSCAFSSFSNK